MKEIQFPDFSKNKSLQKLAKMSPEELASLAPAFVAPSSFLAQHKVGDRGWIFIQGVVIECELVGYMIEVTGENYKSSKPTYKVKFYVVQDGALVEQETVVKESSFKNTLEEVLEDIRKNAILYPGNLSPTTANV